MANTPRVRIHDSARVPRQGVQSMRTDSLFNLTTGMGGDRDKLANTGWINYVIDQVQANAAYRGDWIARKIIDIPAEDATREWRNWQADKLEITEIEEAEKAFALQRKARRAMTFARLYGGGALVMGINQGKPEDPVELDKLAQGSLKFVHAVSKYQLPAGPMDNDIMSPWYGEPTYYQRNLPNGGLLKIHPSRVVRFIGLELPDDMTTSPDDWGDSVLQVVKEAVLAAGLVTNSGAQLVAEAKIDVIKIPGLSENITTTEYENKLKTRFSVASVMKSVYSLLLLDGSEEWERIAANFTNLPEMLQMYMLMACGAGDIPATRFLGQSPAGLSASGESDIRNYYDRCSTIQKTDIAPALDRLDQVMVRSAVGSYPDGLFYNWNPLWQLTPSEKADVAVKKATVFTADVAANLMDPVVLQRARENQLIEDGTYPGLEAIMEEVEAERESGELPPNPNDPANPTPEPTVKLGPDGKPLIDPNVTTGQSLDPAADEPAAAGNIANEDRKRVDARTKAIIDSSSPARSLYVYRKVVNGEDIIKWAASQGFASTVPADQLHVTLVYSRTPIDWMSVPDEQWNQNDKGQVIVAPGGPRVVSVFGSPTDVNAGRAVVLQFNCSTLAWRHEQIIRLGATSDYEDFCPHITFTYNAGDVVMADVVAYQGQIVLGPETFETLKEDYRSTFEELDT